MKAYPEKNGYAISEISRRFGSSAARSKEINQKNYSDLIKHFQGLGLPVVRLTGSWLETGNRISTDPFERSIFVVGDNAEGASQIRRKFAVCYSIGLHARI